MNANDPFFALNVGNRPDGSMYFYLYNQNTKTSYSQTSKNILDGRWFRVEAFYECAGDNTGHITFWQDGQQIFDVPNVQARYISSHGTRVMTQRVWEPGSGLLTRSLRSDFWARARVVYWRSLSSGRFALDWSSSHGRVTGQRKIRYNRPGVAT